MGKTFVETRPFEETVRKIRGEITAIKQGTSTAAPTPSGEPVIVPGTTSDFWRGDKSWQPLTKENVIDLKLASSPKFTSVKIADSNASHHLGFVWNEDRTADQTLNLITGAADRIITLQGNPTLADWFDQTVKIASGPSFDHLHLISGGAGLSLTPYSSASEGSLHLQSSVANSMTALRISPNGTSAYGSSFEFFATGHPGDAAYTRLIHVATSTAMVIASDSLVTAGKPIGIRSGTGAWTALADAITISAASPSLVTIPNLAVPTAYTLAGNLSGNLTHTWATWSAQTSYNAFWYWGIYFDEPTRKLTIQNQSNDSGGNIYILPSLTPAVGAVYLGLLKMPVGGTAFRMPVYSAANVMTELAAVGATGEYLKGNTGAIPSWATLNQAAVAGLTTGSSPEFVTVKCSALTDGYIPYHVSDAVGLANSIISQNATGIGIGAASPGAKLHLASDAGGNLRLERTNAIYLSKWDIVPAQNAAGDLSFVDRLSGDATRLTILASGAVLIGATAA
ncbi:MAG: hypothetical protein IMZ57_11220, partial [Acidobacteria bacterium]|nr:hypothetical protein [Acidobacteriota bacterium]